MTPQLRFRILAAEMLEEGLSREHAAEALVVSAFELQGGKAAPGAAAAWLAKVQRELAGLGVESARASAVHEFDQTALSQLGKHKILEAVREITGAGGSDKIVADALMGAALSYITSRDGLGGLLAYLRVTADQIEDALRRPSTV